jgi:cellulose biosynthesis protein BcsQ
MRAPCSILSTKLYLVESVRLYCSGNVLPGTAAESHAKPYRWTFIDGPPLASDIARSAILASDLVIIPLPPSPLDVWSAKKIVDLISEAAVMKPNLKSVFTINRKIANTAAGAIIQTTA